MLRFQSIQWRAELRRLIQLGVPIFLAQSSQTAMGLADTMMASWAGVDELAAIALGAGLWLPLFISLSGVMIGLTPIVAHLVGADRSSETPVQLHHSLMLALVLGVLGALLLNFSWPFFDLLGVEPALKAKTLEYLFAISWGLPALLIYQAIRAYTEAFGLTRPTMKIGLTAALINIPLNYLLIFGKFGLPELGGVGCGWASSIAFILMLAGGVLYLLKSHHFKPLRPFRRQGPLQLSIFMEHLSVGVPIALSLLIETSMFCIIALLLADLGAEVIAAHQITLSLSGLVFMLPLALCLALTIRIGQLNGARQVHQARELGILGIVSGLGLASFNFSLFTLLSDPLARLYSDNPAVVQLAAQLIGLAALYQFSDALQLASTGALRGYKDTRRPLLIALIAYWCVGLPSGYLLAEPLQWGAAGYWIGILIGLSIGAVLLIQRFNAISKHALSSCPTPADCGAAERL